MVKIPDQVLEREKKVRSVLEGHASLFDVDPNLVRALITQESKFVGSARSPTGALGYGQFTQIAAKQVQQIATITPLAKDLSAFQKTDAADPDKGIKAVCATLWWLLNKKYSGIGDKKVKLECALTFYNAGGKVAMLVQKYGGHTQALPFIKQLSSAERSQGDVYAPQVIDWYVAWHDALAVKPIVAPVEKMGVNPFEGAQFMDTRYKALIEALRLLGSEDPHVDFNIHSREGMTEVTLVFPGEI